MIVIKNGRQMEVPDSPQGVSGRHLIDKGGNPPGRTTVIRSGIRARIIDPDEFYSRTQLITRRGMPISIEEMPDRSKASGLPIAA